MYKVVSAFTDIQDNNHLYSVGDEYPRKGAKANDDRIAELSSKDNKVGVVLIEKVKEKKASKVVSEVPETAEISPETDETAVVEEKVKPKKKTAKKEK